MATTDALADKWIALRPSVDDTAGMHWALERDVMMTPNDFGWLP